MLRQALCSVQRVRGGHLGLQTEKGENGAHNGVVRTPLEVFPSKPRSVSICSPSFVYMLLGINSIGLSLWSPGQASLPLRG